VATGVLDPYIGYRQLYGLWCSNNSAVQELRPLFRIPDVEPDGLIDVTDEFRQTVRSFARQILSRMTS
jgi:hypothetical protein